MLPGGMSSPPPTPTSQQIELHGHPVTYHRMGAGPAVLLVHGITSSSRTWRAVMPAPADVKGLAEGFDSLGDAEARRAFVHTARSVIDPAGQRVDATDRLYLAEHVPSLIVWGERDRMIPVEHGRQAHALMPNSRFE